MGEVSKIEWTDSTFNPVIGCQHVSPGCEHCYAEAWSKRSGLVDWGVHAERRKTSDRNWLEPRRWNAEASVFEHQHGHRRRVFCASLSDWLDNKWERDWRFDLCRMIEDTPRLDWLLLTKRPQNFAKLAPGPWKERLPPNVWFGVTTESAEYYRQRWPIVAKIPARVRFISYEPAVGPLGPLDLGGVTGAAAGIVPDWVIAGGESGAGARVMRSSWVRQAHRECKRHGVAFFLKQYGTYASNPLVQEKGYSQQMAQKADPPSNGKGGGLLDGELHRQFPTIVTR